MFTPTHLDRPGDPRGVASKYPTTHLDRYQLPAARAGIAQCSETLSAETSERLPARLPLLNLPSPTPSRSAPLGGELRSVKVGRRRLIPRSALLELLGESEDTVDDVFGLDDSGADDG